MSSQPEYLAEFSHLRDAALRVGALVAEIEGLLAPPENMDDPSTPPDISTVELEGRLGRFTDTGFDPDIGATAFSLLLQMLEAFPRWSRVEQWEESQDIFYTTDIPGVAIGDPAAPSRSVQVRSTVKAKYQDGCIDENGSVLDVSHVVKRKIGRVDLHLQSVDVGCCALETSAGNPRPVDARISLSVEYPVTSEVLPVAVTSQFVRIKQRKRFFLGSLGVPGDCFSFDLSVVYKGRTRTEAEIRQQKSDAASFEVECECLAPKKYLEATNDDCTCLGLSIVLKLLDFASALNPSSPVTFVPAVNNATHKAGNGFTARTKKFS